jgi:3-phosphoglycerate kinase
MPDNDLTSKAEAARQSVVDALALTGVTVNTGQDDDTLALPNVICSVEQGNEEVIGLGNFRLVARVTVNSSSDDNTLAEHRTRVATVFDAFINDAIHTTLSAAVSGFYAYEIWERRQGKLVKEKTLCDWLEMEFLAAAADL